ncbi:hypothetical protein QOT17_010663 [Balamuthia mandrillaris]
MAKRRTTKFLDGLEDPADVLANDVDETLVQFSAYSFGERYIRLPQPTRQTYSVAIKQLYKIQILAGIPSGVDALRERSTLHESLAPASLRPGRLGEDWHHVPRHKPGQLPKFGGRNQYRQLNDALQNDTMSDPFQSNHQLSKAKNFVVINRFRKCVD